MKDDRIVSDASLGGVTGGNDPTRTDGKGNRVIRVIAGPPDVSKVCPKCGSTKVIIEKEGKCLSCGEVWK